MSDPAPTPAATPAPAVLPSVAAMESIYGPTPSKEPAATPADPPAEPAAPAAAADPPAAEAPPAEADPNAPTEQVEEVELKTIAELAEHFELDPEWLKSLKVSEKVNGAPIEFSIADALATHRKVQAADTYLADAKVRAKASIDEAEAHKQSWATGIATVNELVKELEAEINREARSGDMDKLRREDPAEWSARQKEIDDRRSRLSALKQKATEGVREAVTKTAKEHQDALQQRLPKEKEAFLERVPEWNDDAKGKAEMTALADYLESDGWSANDIRGIALNGRAMALAVKAMRHDQGKNKLETIKKKVVKIPKVLKPGPKPSAPPNPTAKKDDPVSILYG